MRRYFCRSDRFSIGTRGPPTVVYEYRSAGDHVEGVSTLDGQVVDLRVLAAGGCAGYLDQAAVRSLQPLAVPQCDRVDPPAAGCVRPAVGVHPEGVSGGGGERRGRAVDGL